MAKLYRNAEGGGFYDAFGGKIGEVEEVWAGDSFDRSAVDCCYDVAKGADISACTATISAKPATLSFTVDKCDWNTLAELTGSTAIAPADSTISFKGVSGIDAATEKFEELQKQIDELRNSIKVESKLRSDLRTLRYERECV